MATGKATPWGKAALLHEVVLPQHAPGPLSFTTHVRLLETESGERPVRLAYATTAHGGSAVARSRCGSTTSAGCSTRWPIRSWPRPSG